MNFKRLKEASASFFAGCSLLSLFIYLCVGCLLNSTLLKLVKYFAVGLGFGIALLIAGVIYIKYPVTVDFTQTDKVIGKVIKTGVVISSPRSRLSGPAKAFMFQLDNLDAQLGTYRPGDNYSRLLRDIRVGDTITVYFSNHHTYKLNLDVYQIEKNGRIVQDYQSYERNHRKLAVLLGLFGYCLLLYTIAKIHLGKDSKQH